MMTPETTFLIVDDHKVVRLGLAITIRNIISTANVLSVDSFAKALEIVAQQKVDLVILDIGLPDGSSLAMPGSIKKKNKDTKVLMFTGFTEPSLAMRYLKSGADGFLTKDASDEEIKKAIITVLKSELYTNEIVKDYVVSRMVSNKNTRRPVDQLSARESDILALFMNGYSISKIADDLKLKPSTVSTYKVRIFQKMQVTNMIELVKRVKTFD